MRTALKLMATLLATAFMAAAVTPAQAAAVTDQYTEEIPDPGGTGGGGAKPVTKPPKPVNPQPSNSGNGDSGSDGSTDYSGTDYGSSPVTHTSDSGSTGSDSSGKKKADKSKADKSKSEAGKPAEAKDPKPTTTKVSSFTPAGESDGGGGMGWMFPVAIVLVAGIVGAFVYFRRDKDGLAS